MTPTRKKQNLKVACSDVNDFGVFVSVFLLLLWLGHWQGVTRGTEVVSAERVVMNWFHTTLAKVEPARRAVIRLLLLEHHTTAIALPDVSGVLWHLHWNG